MVELNVSRDIEKVYQKKTQLEHILLRPDTYVGSIKCEEQLMWIYDSETDSMIEKKITYNPALYKIFDEILVNASDHKIRDKSMTCIRINIDRKTSEIRIWNNGKGIPVTIHQNEKVYVPTMIFGHLLTSTNFNDDQKKVTGGRNGYGAKLCNIFSTEFKVETCSKRYKRCFKQIWRNNMSVADDPIITPAEAEDYTVISFKPDLAKFGMETLDDDIIGLFNRRAYDIAACTCGVNVYLNNKLIPVKTFKDYVDLYLKNSVDFNDEPLKVVYEKYGDRWEVAVTTSVNDTFTQISFVNSISTSKGGTHVNLITDQMCNKLLDMAKKKLKTDKSAIKLKPSQVKMNLWVFVRALIENPTFESQTKQCLTLQSKDFGSTVTLTEKFVAGAAKCGIMDKITMWATMKNKALMDKKCSKNKQSKVKNVPKLDDANDAGGKNSIHCTLILTEGDSAKTLAVAGLSVIGRDRYGVFPLRGKLLNVREATSKQLLENAELSNLIKIIGLRYTEKYANIESMKSLRYGKILIMTDQDQDGSHIKGLIINFVHTHWPNLLKHGFLEEFITPIVKATRKDHKLSFYSIPELLEWMRTDPDFKKYSLKYYKGLGTSTGKEAKEYFSDMRRHLIKFDYQGVEDDRSILLAFGKNKADERKEWLTTHMEGCKRRRELGQPEEYLYGPNTRSITYKEFINKELILFSNTDNIRSIPSLVDGFKPGQRKVLFTCLKRNLNKELKVAQLAGSVAEISCYHHGEASLMGTIINLAQDFIGSNNINLLMPGGQFGTRLTGGKDSASPRYIFTRLNRLTRLIFRVEDDPVLKYEYDDNQRIEPEFYVPIIPMVLVNGSDGIGTGWSSKVPNYNPMDLIKNLRRKINGEPFVKMHPWYRGFRGTIVEFDETRYISSGEIAIMDSNCLEITELPIKTWTQKYKEDTLEVFLNGSDKVASVITDYKAHNTDVTVRFLIEMNSEKFREAENVGFHKFFKLQSSINCGNMVLFDNLGVIRKFATADDIIECFYKVRLNLYQVRKNYLLGLLSAEANKLQNQARFILEKISGVLKIEDRKLSDIHETLRLNKYDSDPIKAWRKSMDSLEEDKVAKGIEISGAEEGEDINEDGDSSDKPDYAYLTSMYIHQLSREKKEDLLKQRDKKLNELELMKKKTIEEMWLDDLEELEKALKEVEAEEKKVAKPAEGTGGKRAKGAKIRLDELTAPSKFSSRVEPKIEREPVKNNAYEAKKRQQKLMEEFVIRERKSNETEQTVVDDGPAPLFSRIAAEGNVSMEGLELPPVKPKKLAAPKIKDLTKKEKKPAQKRKKKYAWDSGSENASDASNNNEVIDLEAPDDDIIPRDSGIKRRVTQNITYMMNDDKDTESPIPSVASKDKDDDDDDPLFSPDEEVKEKVSVQNSPDESVKLVRKRTKPPKKKDEPKEKVQKVDVKKPKPAASLMKTKKLNNKNKVFDSDDDDASDLFKPEEKSLDDVAAAPRSQRQRGKRIVYRIDSSDDENVDEKSDKSDFVD